MNKTSIEWCRNPDGTQGYTWNPITGCLNHINGLCKGGGFPCYAYRLAHGRLKERYLANDNIANPIATGTRDEIEEETMEKLTDPFYPRFWPERLLEPHSGKGKGIFPCDMSDLFGNGIPHEWTEQVMAVISACSQHRFYPLTKQSQNLIKFSPFPSNCWVGVTFTHDSAMFEGATHLIDIEAQVKFISFEPLLSGLSPLMWHILAGTGNRGKRYFDWLIIGAVTGTKQELLSLKASAALTLMPYGNKWTLQPKIEWVSEIVEAADKAHIPVFIKNNLFPLFRDEMGYLNVSWLRQELPNENR